MAAGERSFKSYVDRLDGDSRQTITDAAPML
jgi:hypothetical protein